MHVDAKAAAVDLARAQMHQQRRLRRQAALSRRCRDGHQGVQGAQVNEADLGRQRGIVDAFLAASRSGDVEALLAVLDPNVVLRSDPTATRMGNQPEMRGATAVASFFKGRAAVARSALIDGQIGVVVAPGGRFLVLLRVTLAGDKIAEIEAIADPEHLGRLNLVVPDADA
jgi:hypothetical protein